MSDAVSALNGAESRGLVSVMDAGPSGMVTVRGDLSADWLRSAIQAVTGAGVPGQRQVTRGSKGAVVWMSYDELLVCVPHETADAVAAALNAGFGREHGTAVNVSDARSVLRIDGAQARDMLAKVCPVDFADFPVNTVRRTRAAQVAAALWRDSDTEWTLVCFRSVGQYVFDLLTTVSREGGAVGLYR